jgi:hypothetical protein
VIPLEEMTDEQFEQYALELLQKELGAYGMARFLHTYRAGTGDYTRDRHQWLDGITVDQIAEEIKERREKSA